MASSYRDYQRRVEARRLGRDIPAHGDDHESETGEDEKELHHLAVYAHEAGTRSRPVWLVRHYHSADGSEPEEEHEFSDGNEMLNHVGKYAAVPGFHEK